MKKKINLEVYMERKLKQFIFEFYLTISQKKIMNKKKKNSQKRLDDHL